MKPEPPDIRQMPNPSIFQEFMIIILTMTGFGTCVYWAARLFIKIVEWCIR